MNKKKLIKSLWTDEDFAQMGWHDVKIHAIAFGIAEYEVAFDIDYILEWLKPNENEETFTFLLSPSTLIFRNVHDLKFDLSSVELTIDDVSRSNPKKPTNSAYIDDAFEYDWLITTSNGDISFKSTGFIQYLRQEPIETKSQSLILAERQGLSFSCTHY